MIEERPESQTFDELAEGLLANGLGFRFQARGRSMLPLINDGELLHVQRTNPATIKVGDIVLFRHGTEFKAHRIIRKKQHQFITRGDAGSEADGAITGGQIVGKIVAKECLETGHRMALEGVRPRLNYFSSEVRRAFSRRLRCWSAIARGRRLLKSLSLIVVLMIVPLTAWGQIGGVAMDNVNSQVFSTADAGCPATPTGQVITFVCTFNHTTNSVIGSTGLLVVGVSLNIKNNIDSLVTGVTYNGVALTAGPNGNPGNNFRAQIFYLKNPPTGTFAVNATVHKTGGVGNTIGVEIGAMTVYRVDLTFTSLTLKKAINHGTSASATVLLNLLNTPGTNDGVVDVLAVAAGITATANTNTTAPLVFENQQWAGSSGASGQDVEGTGSTAGGTGSALTMKEILSASTNWTIVAIAIPASSPTAVKTESFVATQGANGVLLSWKTGGEMHNLGFNVYREVAGAKVQVNPSLIAGSALLMRDTLEKHAAKTYGWMDRSPVTGGMYWLEDVDLNGARTMHGPVTVEVGPATPQAFLRATTMHDLAQPNLGLGLATRAQTQIRETVVTPRPSELTRNTGFQLAARPAVKIFVDHEGWYRITQPQLIAAGFNANVDARSLRLFAEGLEQSIRITGAASGFGSQSAIEFYGTAIDTPYSGQRVYWLMSNGQPGLRVAAPSGTGTSGPQAQSFMQTLELKPRTTYFAVLLQDNTDNFFGPLVSPVAAVQTLNISNLAPGGGSLQVVLQGVTAGQQHNVTVAVNGATLGDMTFNGQQQGSSRFSIPAGVLTNGANAITLTSQLGDNDLSLVDHIDLTFPHTFTAESDVLKFTALAGDRVIVNGFVQPPTRLVDITNPVQPFEVAYKVWPQNGGYALQMSVPWTSSSKHTLLAVSDGQIGVPAALAQHQPSALRQSQAGADVVILAAPQFAAQVQPLALLHRAEGKQVALIDVDQVYDEFNFGERTPFAIRDFLQTATAAWRNKPHYLLLGGDASVDPRDYFGLGFFDFVPTKIVVTSELKTASDDWFSDFSNTGFAQIATGRLPARTAADAQTMVAKILSYANGESASWTNQTMLVADTDDPSVSFTRAAQAVQKLLPQTMNVNDVFAGTVGTTAHQDILAGINSGQLLVNYNGHGSVEIWGSNLFDDTTAASLTNGNRLPVFVIMNCLNGFFHDVFTQSLAEALLLSKNGGAVAVWASSGLTAPGPQFQMDQTLVKTLFAQPSITLGDAVLFAKSGITDQDVRKTFILFGDPLMRLKQPGGAGQIPVPTLPAVSRPQILDDRGR